MNLFSSRPRGAVMATAVLLSLGLYATSAQAATFTVTNLNNSGAGSLRQAILDANRNGNSTETDTITFAPDVTGTINLSTIGDTSAGNSAFRLSQNVNIQGPGANVLTVRRDTGGNYRLFLVPTDVTAHISGLTLSNASDSTTFGGGAILNLGTLSLTDSTLSGNTSTLGGGIFTVGALLVERCLFASNTSAATAGGLCSATTNFRIGNPVPTNNTQVRNSTFVGNTAAVFGGGVYNANGLTTLDSCTIVGNTASAGQGAGVLSYNDNTTVTRVRNSIIVGNLQTDGTNGSDVDHGDTTQPYDSQGYNLVGTGNSQGDFSKTGDSQSQTLATVKLDSSGDAPRLADNGGPTQTVALVAGSPAIDAGQTDLTQDQRGIPRPQRGVADDIGAFEYINTSPLISSVTITPGSPTTNDTLTANVSANDAEGDTLTYSYEWKKGNTVLADEFGSTLNLSKAGNGDKGDTISVTVRARDAFGGTSAPATSSAVTIGNSAPRITSGTLLPMAPLTNSVLTTTVGARDADDDSLTYSYVWKKNGEVIVGESGPTLDLSKPGNGDNGDTIIVTVIASDGTSDSIAAELAPVTINNRVPVVDSASPQGATDKVGDKRTFSLTVSDENGASDIKEAWLLVNTDLSWGAGATFIYVPSASSPTTGLLYLRRGDAFLPPVQVGSSSTAVLDNGAVRVVGSEVTVTVSSNSLTLNIPATIREGLVGQNTLFTRVVDRADATDSNSLAGDNGYIRSGTYTVTSQFSGPNVAPVLSKLAPGATYTALNASGVAPGAQRFVFYVSDANGTSDIESVWFLANKQLNWTNSATIVYQPKTRRLFLRSDDGSTFLGGGQIGQVGIIENSQVRIDLSKVTVNVYPDGKSFGLTLLLQAKKGLLGQNTIWLRAQDKAGVIPTNSNLQGYVQSGTWNVVQGKATTAPSAPSNGNS